MKLTNRTAVITGASQGFGLALAKKFAGAGANLVLAARGIDLLKKAKAEIEAESGRQVVIVQADVASEADNQKVAEEAISHFDRIDVFVANAGVYGPKGPIESVDWSEWSQALDINLKGVILGCRAVIPGMKKNRQGKIIILSGGGATKPMPNLSAYAVSKAGVVRFMETLADELVDHNIQVNAVAPGALNTRLLEEVLTAGPERVGKNFYEQSLKQKASGGTPLHRGVDLCVYLAAEDSDPITGRLISAVWDPWESLHLRAEELKNSDIYTLRRIVPEDRNKKW
jgi:NAD(P)-dependent dehydrogenase (short-subunit alcohol dehydrogenase family)